MMIAVTAAAVTGSRKPGRCDVRSPPGLRLRCSGKAVLPSVKPTGRDARRLDRCGAGQRVAMAGPIARAVPWPLTNRNRRTFHIADAIGVTLPEGVAGFAGIRLILKKKLCRPVTPVM